MLDEYKLKQLEDQEGKLIDAYASGDLEMVERKFNAIASFILNKEEDFVKGIESDRVKNEAEMKDAKHVFADGIRKASELVEDDELILASFKCFEALQNVERGVMSRYPYELVNSVSSYTRKLNGRK